MDRGQHPEKVTWPDDRLITTFFKKMSLLICSNGVSKNQIFEIKLDSYLRVTHVTGQYG